MHPLSSSFKESWTSGTFLRNRGSGSTPRAVQHALDSASVPAALSKPREGPESWCIRVTTNSKVDLFEQHSSGRIHSLGQIIYLIDLSIAKRGNYSSRLWLKLCLCKVLLIYIYIFFLNCQNTLLEQTLVGLLWTFFSAKPHPLDLYTSISASPNFSKISAKSVKQESPHSISDHPW